MDFLNPLARRVKLAIRRVIVNLIDDSQQIQTVQLQGLADEVHDTVEHLHAYGFTSSPLPGAEGIGVAVGGSTSHTVLIVADDRRYRLKNLGAGQVAMYDNQGNYVWFKADGLVQINAMTKLNVVAPETEFSGDVTIDGALTVKQDINGQANVSDETGSMQTMREQYNPHTHDGGSPPDPEMT
jgi:phage baseplate assembly protein V